MIFSDTRHEEGRVPEQHRLAASHNEVDSYIDTVQYHCLTVREINQ
jgi:hypothetical protein